MKCHFFNKFYSHYLIIATGQHKIVNTFIMKIDLSKLNEQ